MVTDKTDSHTQRERRRQMVTDRENILAGIGNSGLSKELPTSTMFRPDKLRCHSRKMYSYVLHWFPILPLANKMILSFSSSSPRHLTSLLSFPKRLLFSLFPLFSFSPSISLYQWLLIPVFRLFSSPSLPSPRPCLLFSAFLHISFPFHLLSKFPPSRTFCMWFNFCSTQGMVHERKSRPYQLKKLNGHFCRLPLERRHCISEPLTPRPPFPDF